MTSKSNKPIKKNDFEMHIIAITEHIICSHISRKALSVAFIGV